MFALRALALGLAALDSLRLDNACIKTGPNQFACGPGYPTTSPTSLTFPNTNAWAPSSFLSNQAVSENSYGSYPCIASDESRILQCTTSVIDEPNMDDPPHEQTTHPYSCTNKSGSLQCQTLSYEDLKEPDSTHESLLYDLLAAFLSWPQAHPLQAAQLLACIAAPAYSDTLVLYALCNVGFCVSGIRAGTSYLCYSGRSIRGVLIRKGQAR